MADEIYVAMVALGPDRPGIVASATGVLSEYGANIEDSRAAVLGGEFALMLLVSVPAGPGPEPSGWLAPLESATGLRFTISETMSPEEHRKLAAVPYTIEANTLDNEGIVHALTNALYGAGVNIVKMDTVVSNAPVTGTPLFGFSATVDIPAGVTFEAVRAALAAVAKEHNLDVEARAV